MLITKKKGKYKVLCRGLCLFESGANQAINMQEL